MTKGAKLEVITIGRFISYIYFSSNIKQPGIMHRYSHYEEIIVVSVKAYIYTCIRSKNCFRELDDTTFLISLQSAQFII